MLNKRPRKFKDEVIFINPLEPIKKVKVKEKNKARVIFVGPTPEEERAKGIIRKIEEEKAKKKRKEHSWRGDITDVRFN